MSIEGQTQIKSLLLTHSHFDHIKDIPLLALNLFNQGSCIKIYGTDEVCKNITAHILNGTIYPEFQKIPKDQPTVQIFPIEPYKEYRIEGLDIIALPVNHPTNPTGYRIKNSEGRSFFYTADTGPGISDCWKYISPDLILAEATVPNSHHDFAIQTGHLTPHLLEQELIQFKRIKGYMPRVIVVHTHPVMDTIIEKEIREISQISHIRLDMGYEGMNISV